ncbi:hypothetical protein IF2G_03269 [Cordyceps javanica]|nr:hypothetical protein IF2G_03269 [Cordyceps javanica]
MHRPVCGAWTLETRDPFCLGMMGRGMAAQKGRHLSRGTSHHAVVVLLCASGMEGLFRSPHTVCDSLNRCTCKICFFYSALSKLASSINNMHGRSETCRDMGYTAGEGSAAAATGETREECCCCCCRSIWKENWAKWQTARESRGGRMEKKMVAYKAANQKRSEPVWCILLWSSALMAPSAGGVGGVFLLATPALSRVCIILPGIDMTPPGDGTLKLSLGLTSIIYDGGDVQFQGGQKATSAFFEKHDAT